MNLQEYIDSKTTGKQKVVPADTCAKWQKRNAVAYGPQGEAGAVAYMSQYAKTAAAPKVIDLGRLALEAGFPEFSAGFFKRAAELEGVTLEVSDVGNPNIGLPSTPVMARATAQAEIIPGFPCNMQPGRFAPMQPSDAKHDRDHYILNPRYWGQGKRDGDKLICFVTASDVWYQSRSMKLNGPVSVELHNVLREYARPYGNSILEGELTFLDYESKEHMSGAQALEVNQKAGYDRHLPVMKYYVFSCPWIITNGFGNYGDMVNMGYEIARHLHYDCDVIQPIETATTQRSKEDMARHQYNEGREGEVWFDPNMPYTPDKNRQDIFVRTKYYVEFTALCVGFTETTAEGHAFGAMVITDLDNNPLGNIGTGFTREEKIWMVHCFSQTGPFKVEIRSQRMTEYGKTRHGCFLRIVE